jgi:hypothetical protein
MLWFHPVVVLINTGYISISLLMVVDKCCPRCGDHPRWLRCENCDDDVRVYTTDAERNIDRYYIHSCRQAPCEGIYSGRFCLHIRTLNKKCSDHNSFTCATNITFITKCDDRCYIQQRITMYVASITRIPPIK